MKAVLAAPLALLLAAVASAEDCKDCTAEKICLTHEASDDIAIKGLEVQLKTKDMMGKRGAIKDLAESLTKHLNARSRKGTMALGKALGDADVDVKMLAADKLCELGDPATAVTAIGQQIDWYKKQIGNTKPKKGPVAAWESNLKLLSAMYEALARLGKEPSAVAIFAEDVGDSSAYICKAAADACGPLKGQKGIVRPLYEAMKRWLGPSTHAPVPEGVTDAFFAMSRALEAVVEDLPKAGFGGKNQNESAAIWDAWWKTHEAQYPEKK